MDKFSFIKKVLSLYPFVTAQDNEGSYYDTYTRILTNKIDYNKLWGLFSENFGKYPPTGKELKELALQCYLQENIEASKKMLHVEIFDKTLKLSSSWVFPFHCTDEKVLEYFKKRFKRDDFEIISREIK